jgi:peptide/nickel transport system ATP-binding protein
LAVAAQLAHRIAVMQNGELIETGPAWQVLGSPRHAYTQRLPAAVPSAATRDRWLSSPGLRPSRAMDAHTEREPIFEMRDVSVRFGRRRDGTVFTAVAGVSLTVHTGETLGVVGESESGKTRLGKVALALRRPDEGEVLFRGQPWSALPERARRPLRQAPLSSFDPR